MISRVRWSPLSFGDAHLPPVADSIAALMAARLGVAYALLAVGVLQQIFQASGPNPSIVSAYALLAAAFGFNWIAALANRHIPPGARLAVVHIVFDTVLISIWVSLAAPREHVYSLLYLVHILAVALTLYQRAALLAAVAACVGFGFAMWLAPVSVNWALWAVSAVLFVGLGLVGGYLAQELHRTTSRLEVKSRKIDTLIAMQERLLSRMPTGLIAVDGSLRVGFVNPAAALILELNAQEAVGQPLQTVAPQLMPFFAGLPPENEAAQTAQDAAGARHDERHHTYFLSPDAKTGVARLQQLVEFGEGASYKLLRGDVAVLEAGEAEGGLLHSGATEGRVLLFQDITRLWKLEETLKQNEKLAAVGQLAAGIAHEIRNPLAGMSASIELLRSSLAPEAVGGENRKLMDIALKEIDRLNQLVSEFLDYVKPQRLKVEAVDISQIVADVLFALRHPEKPGRIKSLKGGIEVRTDIELVECPGGEAVASAHPQKLKQVIWNLVINAIQAMDKPGRIEVGWGPARASGRVVVWVSDQGRGMDEKTMSHLYEPFFTTKEKGTGLGLATAYKIVESFQGELTVQSVPGQGTRFEVVLPAAS